MAPEQAAGRHDELGPETDVYALGALLFALLTGGPPFRSETAVQTILDVIHREPQAPSSLNDSIDPGLEAICLKCLAKTPEGRYRSAQELADDLDRFLDGRAVEATPMTAWRRRLIWLRDIPLVAAISGRHARPTPAHRRAQWMLLAAIMSAPLLAMAAWYVDHRIAQQMPNPVLIAAGSKGGVYDAFSRGLQPALAENAGVEVEVVESAGSGANRRLLATRGAHLALLQHVDLVPQQVHVIAPLYYEVVHVVVPIESDVRSIEDLAGRRVSLGPRNSGMRAAATAVLKHYQVDVASLRETERSYADLLDGDARLDAAIVTIGLSGDRIREILSSGRCKLIPLVDTANIRHPTLRPFTIEIEHYPAAQLEAPVQTVATPAFLATYPGAPDALVRTTLEQLFERPANIPGRITRDQASAWPGITFHPVAGELFGMTNDLGMPND
jgi:hypothetical protein